MLALQNGNSASKEIGELTENGSTAALIAARPGPLRDGLRALVKAIPQIKTVHQAGDIPSACQTIAKHRPTLVLLDGSMNGNGIESLLKTIRVQKAGCRCILLAENIQQQQEAIAAGVDVVLPQGFPAAKLFETVDKLLSDSKATSR
jgi:DNA-binding NarL/FixJ family response regulator